jgi:hypothetical protein
MLGSKDAMATIAVRDPGVPVTLRRDEQSEELLRRRPGGLILVKQLFKRR